MIKSIDYSIYFSILQDFMTGAMLPLFQDELNGYFKNVNDQVEEVCTKIQADPLLANGYHAVGFSQGGQFL